MDETKMMCFSFCPFVSFVFLVVAFRYFVSGKFNGLSDMRGIAQIYRPYPKTSQDARTSACHG